MSREISNPVFHIGMVINGLSPIKFLPITFQFPNLAEKVLLELIPASIWPSYRIEEILESESISEAGFNGGIRRKKKFLVVTRIGLSSIAINFCCTALAS